MISHVGLDTRPLELIYASQISKRSLVANVNWCFHALRGSIIATLRREQPVWTLALVNSIASAMMDIGETAASVGLGLSVWVVSMQALNQLG